MRIDDSTGPGVGTSAAVDIAELLKNLDIGRSKRKLLASMWYCHCQHSNLVHQSEASIVEDKSAEPRKSATQSEAGGGKRKARDVVETIKYLLQVATRYQGRVHINSRRSQQSPDGSALERENSKKENYCPKSMTITRKAKKSVINLVLNCITLVFIREYITYCAKS